MRGLPAEGTWRKLTRSRRRGQPVFGDLRRCNGAEWKRGPVALVTGGAGMERSGTGLNWRSQAPKPADVSLKAAFGDSSAVKGSRGRTALDCLGYFLDANYRQIVADEVGDEEKCTGEAILNLF